MANRFAKYRTEPQSTNRFAKYRQESETDTDRSIGQVGSDLLVSLGAGGAALLESGGNLYGLVTGNMDNRLSTYGAEKRQQFQEMKSPELQEMERQRSQRVETADGFWAKTGTAFWETMKSPSLLSSLVAEQLPMFLPVGGVGTATGLAARGLGAGVKAASRAGTAAAVGTGAAMQGSDAGSQAYDQLMSLPDRLWNENEEYRSLLPSVGQEEAKRRVATDLSRNAAFTSGLASAALNYLIPGAKNLETALSGGKLKGGALGNIARSYLGETLQEGAEEGYGAYTANVQTSRIDSQQDAMEGVGEAAGMGAAAGIFGAVAGARSERSDPTRIIDDVISQPSIDDAIRTGQDILDQPASRLADEPAIEPVEFQPIITPTDFEPIPRRLMDYDKALQEKLAQDQNRTREEQRQKDRDFELAIMQRAEQEVSLAQRETEKLEILARYSEETQPKNTVMRDALLAAFIKDRAKTQSMPEPRPGIKENLSEVTTDLSGTRPGLTVEDATARVEAPEPETILSWREQVAGLAAELEQINREIGRFTEENGTRDTLKAKVAELGGLDLDNARSEGFLDVNQRFNGSWIGRRNGGLTMDAMVERLVDEGYTQFVDPKTGNPDKNLFMDALDQSLRGVQSDPGAPGMEDLGWMKQRKEDIEVALGQAEGALYFEIEAYNEFESGLSIDQVDVDLVEGITDQERQIVESMVRAYHRGLSIDEAKALLNNQEDLASDYQVYLEFRKREFDQTNNESLSPGETVRQRASSEVVPENNPAAAETFQLEQEQDGVIRQPAAEQPAPQDVPSPDGFLLTGSDAEVDQAEARGQSNLFDKPLESKLKAAPRTRGISVEDATKAVEKFRSRFGDAVEVVKSINDLPPNVVESLALPSSSARNMSRGIYYRGKAYLIADNLIDAKDAQTVYMHEVVGHKGVIGMMTVKEWKAQVGKFKTLVKSGNKRAKSIYDEVRARYKGVTDDVFWLEFIAVAAEQNERQGAVGKIMAEIRTAIRKFLRSIGITTIFSDSEIDIVLSNSAKYLESKKTFKPGPVVEEAFSAAEQAPARTGTDQALAAAGQVQANQDPFFKENQRIRDQDKTIWDKSKQFLKRQLAPGGLLPDSAFNLKIDRDNKMQVDEFDIAHMIGELDRAVTKEYGARLEDLSDNDKRALSEALSGGEMPNVRPETRVIMVAMRQKLDNTSRLYLDALRNEIAMLDESAAYETESDASEPNSATNLLKARQALYDTIEGNLGSYVHRSYQAFDDPKWPKRVPTETLNAARQYLTQRNLESGMTQADAAQKAEVALNELLKAGTAYDTVGAFIKEGRLGEKDTSILMRRNNELAPEIRAVLGEYVDPRINFAKSMTKMSRLIWNDTFLKRMKESGMNDFFFHKDVRPPEATKRIRSKADDSYSPLTGLYTFPEVEQALIDALGKEQMGNIMRTIIQANGLVKFGKAQPLTSTVYTPNGPVQMGELAVGDFVCGANGRTLVTGIFPQGKLETYRIKFSDGAEVEASGEHLWEIQICNNKKPKIMTTDELRRLPAYRFEKRQISVPVAEADFNKQKVPIDPYVLGALLGDGSFRSPATVRISSVDQEILDMVANGLPENHIVNHPKSWAACDYSITSVGKKENKIRVELAKLGLWGKCSKTKFIPDIYKYNSKEVRLGIVQGLLDTDGWVICDGQPALSVSNERLARDFAYICTSLGMPCLVTRKKTAGADSFTVKVKCKDSSGLFNLGRKIEKCRSRKKPVHRTIVSIDHIGERECQCISVEDNRHLYMTDGFVLTHNTVLSPTTAARNWQSAFFFAVANGHLNLTHIGKSVSGLREYFSHSGETGRLNYLRKLKDLGVVYDAPYAGEMMRLLEDSGINDWLIGQKSSNPIRQGIRFAQKFYQYGDDFWKIVGFENEKAALQSVGFSESEAEVEAAKRIRNTYPTYSLVGRAVRGLARFPLAGTFVSFPAEIIRTSANMLRYVASDMKDPRLRPLAIRRIGGLAIASSFAAATQQMSKMITEIDDDDEEAIRLLAAPWNKNSNLMFLGRDDDGNIRYVDLSYLDPYNFWKRPINAILRDQPWEQTATDIAAESLLPFFGTDIATQTLFEIFANKKAGSGTEVYNENDTIPHQIGQIADHLRKGLQPGFVSNLERTYKAMEGEISPSGQQYDMRDEMFAWIGHRVTTLDPKTALLYRAYEFSEQKSDASMMINRKITDPNDVSDRELEKAFELSEKIRVGAYEDMFKLVEAVEKSGLTRSQIIETLQAARLSKADAIALANRKVPQYRINKQTRTNAIRNARRSRGQDHAAEVLERYSIVGELVE